MNKKLIVEIIFIRELFKEKILMDYRLYLIKF